MGYSYQGDEKKAAKGLGRHVNVSYKQSSQVCRAIRGMKVERALNYLDNVQEQKEFVEYKRHNKKIPHRKGGTPGRFPKKASKEIKAVIVNARANAEFKGMDTTKLKVEHAAAYKSMVIGRVKPVGRARPSNIELTDIEVVVKEV